MMSSISTATPNRGPRPLSFSMSCARNANSRASRLRAPWLIWNPTAPILQARGITCLATRLPALPPMQNFWDALPEFFAWLETGIAPETPAAYRITVGETVLRARTLRVPVSRIAQSYLEIIRFAAANRLCVELLYKDETRRIEPYSLRQTKDGNIILHAYDTRKQGHRSYRLDRVQGVQTTGETFIPRYAVELNPSGPVSIRPTTTRTPRANYP